MALEAIELRTQIANYNKQVFQTVNPVYITDYQSRENGIEFTLFSPQTSVGFPNGTCFFQLENEVDLARCLALLIKGCGPKNLHLEPRDVKWIVNDSAELGVMIGNQCFFFYKGASLEYQGKHDTGEPRKYRPVGQSEYGDTIHPKMQDDGVGIVGTMPFYEGHEWFDMPTK